MKQKYKCKLARLEEEQSIKSDEEDQPTPRREAKETGKAEDLDLISINDLRILLLGIYGTYDPIYLKSVVLTFPHLDPALATRYGLPRQKCLNLRVVSHFDQFRVLLAPLLRNAKAHSVFAKREAIRLSTQPTTPKARFEPRMDIYAQSKCRFNN